MSQFILCLRLVYVSQFASTFVHQLLGHVELCSECREQTIQTALILWVTSLPTFSKRSHVRHRERLGTRTMQAISTHACVRQMLNNVFIIEGLQHFRKQRKFVFELVKAMLEVTKASNKCPPPPPPRPPPPKDLQNLISAPGA